MYILTGTCTTSCIHDTNSGGHEKCYSVKEAALNIDLIILLGPEMQVP